MKSKNKLYKLYEYCYNLRDVEPEEERHRLIKEAEKIVYLFVFRKNKPEIFSPEMLEKIDRFQESLSDDDLKLLKEVYMARFMGFYFNPPEFSIEEIKSLNDNKEYFVFDELVDIMDWEASKPIDQMNTDKIDYILDCIDKHLYFDTVEEAEAAAAANNQK